MDAQTHSEDATPSRTNLALGVSLLAVALYVLSMAVAGDDETDYGFLWPLTGAVGLVGALLAWRPGQPKPTGRALAAVILGGLVFAVILGWVVVAAFTGDL